MRPPPLRVTHAAVAVPPGGAGQAGASEQSGEQILGDPGSLLS